eukprot:CAMPEP_0183756846 /NCGR_PEP_ID=MMETSP0739-20130205/5320_1 /TAXON_ID=385413 /ORGANISM="Thalassiosira miniscula, Strain CCMP1093" /LENGTH=97 /DNA_ID=CAMNT_0025994129 /DNA_START=293 /DNA_END=586 /DNA_ORIENTATION=-
MATSTTHNENRSEEYFVMTLGLHSGNNSKQSSHVPSRAFSITSFDGGRSVAMNFSKSFQMAAIHLSITLLCSSSPVPLASAFPNSPMRVAPAAVNAS